MYDAKHRERTAFHEAGHAVMAVAKRQRMDLVVILPEGKYRDGIKAGAVLLSPGPITPCTPAADARHRLRQVMIYLAGPLAEIEKFGSWSSGAVSDIAHINELREGLSPQSLRYWPADWLDRAKADVKLLWPAIDAVARVLLIVGALKGHAVREIVAVVMDRAAATASKTELITGGKARQHGGKAAA